MGLTPEMGSVMIVHGGGVFGDKAATLMRWGEAFRALPATTQQYIALENDDYHYTALDLLPTCVANVIPLCIDFFHHMCNGIGPDGAPFDIYDPALLARIMATWSARHIKPKCHWSDQAPDARKGSHADYIVEIPAQLLAFARTYHVDIMCECKMKDECALRLLKKHFTCNITPHGLYWELR